MRRFAALLLLACAVQGCSISMRTESPSGEGSDGWLELTDPVLNQRRIFVVGDITERSAAEVIRQLMYLDAQGERPVDLYLMTPGGDLNAAFAVERVIQTMRSKVNTHAVGECNSSGALLLAAGTGERTAFDDVAIVIHGMVVKNRPPARYVELTQEAYTAFWRRQAKLPEGWLPLPPGKVIVLSAREALGHGIIDAIVKRPAPGSRPGVGKVGIP